MKSDEDDGKFVLGGPTAGAKRASDGGAVAIAKLATSTTAAWMKTHAKDRTNARQDDPAEMGGNPKVPPKSGFPFAAFVKDVLSGDKGKDDFVLKGLAAGAKGARARNTIATPKGGTNQKAHQPRGEASWQASKPQMADSQANNPQVLGLPFAALFGKNYAEPGPHGSAAHFLGGASTKGWPTILPPSTRPTGFWKKLCGTGPTQKRCPFFGWGHQRRDGRPSSPRAQHQLPCRQPPSVENAICGVGGQNP